MRGAAARCGAIGFTDLEKPRAEEAAASIHGKVYGSNIEAARKGDYLFLAVKPQVLDKVLEEIAPVLEERMEQNNAPVLVSMAPGWTIQQIQSRAQSLVPVARIMPNTPALISQGVIVLCTSPEVPPEKASELEKILQGAGSVERLPEGYLDAVTGLSGSGPAFVFLFIEALADGGVQAGLPRDKALSFAARTVLGSAALVLETGKHPGELKDMVCSPGGTTIAGVSALENGAFRGTVMNAVYAAYQRSLNLG